MKKILKAFGILWLLFGLAFFAYSYYSFEAREFDKSILKSNAELDVDISKRYILFSPKTTAKGTVFFYPGALVDPHAYAPLCHRLSIKGYKTFLMRMPWRMATMGYNQITDFNLLDGKSEKNILIGHSQGGKMAAQFVYENEGHIDYLVLLGTTHPRDIDLSNKSIKALKIYGSNDGVASVKKINKNKSKLPPTTTYFKIQGANHSQFGFYGHQMGDNRADITRTEQLNITIEKILEFLDS